MKYIAVLSVIILAFLFQSCASDLEAVRAKEKFTRTKKYAVMPFSGGEKGIGFIYADAMGKWLSAYDYEIIDTATVRQILSKNKITYDEILKNFMSAVGRINEFDGIIMGNIYYGKKDSRTAESGNSTMGGSIWTEKGSTVGDRVSTHVTTNAIRDYVDKCDVYVIGLKDGEVLGQAVYVNDLNSSSSDIAQADELCRKLAQRLSAH